MASPLSRYAGTLKDVHCAALIDLTRSDACFVTWCRP